MVLNKKKGKTQETEEKEVTQTRYTGTDGKWGWFVVFNSFICNVIVDGMQYTFANFLLPIAVTFDTGVTSVALIGSLLSGFYNFSGPVAGALGNKFGFRMVVITGSLVSAGGLMLSYFAPGTEYLYFFYGVLGGLGFGMVYMASVITTSVYFEKYRALAASLSVCGTGVGTFLFSPLGSWLVRTLGWRYALVAEGGMVLLCLVCGMSFKPVEIISVVPIANAEASSTSFSYASVVSSNIRQGGSVYYPTELKKTAPNEMYPTFKEALQMQDETPERRRSSEVPSYRKFSYADADGTSIRLPQHHIYSLMGSIVHTEPELPPKGRKQKCRRCCRICCFNFWHCRCKKRNLTLGDRPLYRDDIFYGGSLSSLGNYTSSERLKYHLSVTRVPDAQELEQHETRKCCVCHHAVLRTCATMTGFNLLRSKVFTFLCISSFFYTMSLFIPYVFIRKVANQYGIEHEHTVWLVSALGISNTVGRLLSGVVKSFLPVNAPLMVLFCLLISGLIGFSFLFIVNLPVLVIYSCFYGFFTAPFISLRPIIIVEFLGLEKLTNAFGLVLLSQGVASILGPPLAGYLEEHTGNSLYVIYFSGSLLIIATFALLVATILHMVKDVLLQKNVHLRRERKIEQVGPMQSEQGEEEHLYAIVPPNGGWGWLVVFCAFYCNVVVDGIQLTFGVFLKSISKDLKAEYSQVALAASLMFGIHLLMGPVCCGFNNAFGLRPVTIVGSLLCGFGIAISYFSTNYHFLCFSFGVIGGIGLGLVYMNTLVITSLYFTTLLPAAIAVVVSGTGVGTMIFAGMGSFFLRWTTWQNSFLFQALLAVSMSIAAISFKPLKPLRVKLERRSDQSTETAEPTDQTSADEEHGGKSTIKTAILIKSQLSRAESYASLAGYQSAARSFIQRVISSEFRLSQKPERCPKCARLCRRKKKHLSDGKDLRLTEVRSDINSTHQRTYVEKGHEDDLGNLGGSYSLEFTRIDIPQERFKHKVWNHLKTPIVKMFDFHLLKSFDFVLFATIGATELSSFLIVLIYIKDRNETLGFEEKVSVFFIVAIGASNVFWRLFLGGIALIPGVHHGALSVSSIVIGGIATMVSGLCGNIFYQFGYCILFSLAMASFAVFRMPFLVELVGVEKIENATGICLLFMGVGCIVSPPISGLLLKLTNSFDPMFITSGSVTVLSGFMQFAVTRKKIKERNIVSR